MGAREGMNIDKKVIICSPGVNEHTMLHMLRHPDRSIYINAHKLGLVRSTDEGESWTQIPLNFTDATPNQDPGGFGITRDGRLWVVHQPLQGDETDMFISCSTDDGRSWKTRQVAFGHLSPGGADDPYVTAGVNRCYLNFLERPDGTLMFSCSLRYADWMDYTQKDQSRPGIRDVMIRSTDGGKTWGDPTVVHQHATETQYAVDPADPDHILAASRKQRQLLSGEDQATVEKLTGCEPGAGYPYKGGLLLESIDGARSFHEVPDSYLGYYSHRATILWTGNNVVLVTHQNEEGALLARISLDGGKTWLDGTMNGTPAISNSKGFVMTDDHSFPAPTVELAVDHFLTACVSQGNVEGFFWHIERDSDGIGLNN